MLFPPYSTVNKTKEVTVASQALRLHDVMLLQDRPVFFLNIRFVYVLSLKHQHKVVWTI